MERRERGRGGRGGGEGGDCCSLQAGSHLSAWEGKEGGCCIQERDFLLLFLSCRTLQIKPLKTANQQLTLAQIPKGPARLQCQFLHSLLPGRHSCSLELLSSLESVLTGGCKPHKTAELGLENRKPPASQVTACPSA